MSISLFNILKQTTIVSQEKPKSFCNATTKLTSLKAVFQKWRGRPSDYWMFPFLSIFSLFTLVSSSSGNIAMYSLPSQVDADKAPFFASIASSLQSRLLICSKAKDHGLEHGDDPHGKDPHDEIRDNGLPSTKIRRDNFQTEIHTASQSKSDCASHAGRESSSNSVK